MRKITRLLVTAALLVAGVGGVKAAKRYLYFNTPWYCNASWNSTTNTFTWGIGSGMNEAYVFMEAIDVKGDLSSYTSFHMNATSFSANASAQELIVTFKSGYTNQGPTKSFNVSPNENGDINIDLTAVTDWGDCDIHNIYDFTIWGCARKNNAQNASVVISDAYFYKSSGDDKVTTKGPDVIKTSLAVDDIVAIYNASEDKYLYGSDSHNLGFAGAFKVFQSSNPGYLFKVEMHEGHYMFLLQKPEGGDYSVYGQLGYLNSQLADRDCCFILGLKDQYGQDAPNLGLWDVEAVTGGFKIKNVGTGKYLNDNSHPAKYNEDEAAVWTFCTLKDVQIENDIEKPTRTATDAKIDCFDEFKTISSDATWNSDTRVFTKKCGWQWSGEGLDLSQYRYLVITAAQNRDGNCGDSEITIKDDKGTIVSGDQYGVAYMNMWFSKWNHHNCCLIDLEKLRSEKMFDVYHISELSINGGSHFVLGNVYASNLAPVTQNPWNQSSEGSDRITGKTPDKFGTICLPYQAAVAGAYIYEITGKKMVGDKVTGISVSQYNGLLVPGKAYFYCTIPNASNEERNIGNTTNNVYFYKTTNTGVVGAPVASNGLVGTFDGTTAPVNTGDENIYYVLSNNQLYKVDSDVNVGANKAYIDLSQITSTSTARSISLLFNEPTGINAVSAEGFTGNGEFYNLQGQRVSAPRKGLYIVNGKVIVIK